MINFPVRTASCVFTCLRPNYANELIICKFLSSSSPLLKIARINIAAAVKTAEFQKGFCTKLFEPFSQLRVPATFQKKSALA